MFLGIKIDSLLPTILLPITKSVLLSYLCNSCYDVDNFIWRVNATMVERHFNYLSLTASNNIRLISFNYKVLYDSYLAKKYSSDKPNLRIFIVNNISHKAVKRINYG